MNQMYIVRKSNLERLNSRIPIQWILRKEVNWKIIAQTIDMLALGAGRANLDVIKLGCDEPNSTL